MLIAGSELVIRGSVSIALRFGISSLVVGLTVVSFGTSSPELVISIKAALNSNGGIALGNVIGSNIANIALVLGAAAIITPLNVKAQIVGREIPIMILVSLLLAAFMYNETISPVEGVILTLGIIIYIIFSYVWAKRESEKKVLDDFEHFVQSKNPRPLFSVLMLVAGVAFLIIGSELFMSKAVIIAQSIGVSNAVIGLTVIAVGTSLPELVTSVLAAIKKEADIAIGNAVGSNIFNILSIVGISSIVQPLSTEEIKLVDIGMMLILALLLLPFSKSKLKLSRAEGSVLILIYSGYIFYLFLKL